MLFLFRFLAGSCGHRTECLHAERGQALFNCQNALAVKLNDLKMFDFTRVLKMISVCFVYKSKL